MCELVNIHKDNTTTFKMQGVVCPDCGQCGGNPGPCWCHNCHQKGDKVMMLPSCNGGIQCNWAEMYAWSTSRS